MKRVSLFLFVVLSVFILPNIVSANPLLRWERLIPYSGRWGDSGRECARGMADAAKWFNQREGVSGRKLEILLVDDTSQPAEFMAAYRKLNEADRILVLYLYSTETALALAPHFHRDRIPNFYQLLAFPIGQRIQISLCFLNHPNPSRFSKNSHEFHLGQIRH